jgi:hypothetical protein
VENIGSANITTTTILLLATLPMVLGLIVLKNAIWSNRTPPLPSTASI